MSLRKKFVAGDTVIIGLESQSGIDRGDHNSSFPDEPACVGTITGVFDEDNPAYNEMGIVSVNIRCTDPLRSRFSKGDDISFLGEDIVLYTPGLVEIGRDGRKIFNATAWTGRDSGEPPVIVQTVLGMVKKVLPSSVVSGHHPAP